MKDANYIYKTSWILALFCLAPHPQWPSAFLASLGQSLFFVDPFPVLAKIWHCKISRKLLTSSPQTLWNSTWIIEMILSHFRYCSKEVSSCEKCEIISKSQCFPLTMFLICGKSCYLPWCSPWISPVPQ